MRTDANRSYQGSGQTQRRGPDAAQTSRNDAKKHNFVSLFDCILVPESSGFSVGENVLYWSANTRGEVMEVRLEGEHS